MEHAAFVIVSFWDRQTPYADVRIQYWITYPWKLAWKRIVVVKFSILQKDSGSVLIVFMLVKAMEPHKVIVN
jgi:hypothetical protein